ncbi:MAG TPA: hypothetical protein VMU56_05440 [Beijerinckiaceae bacterium]|nr:hypothetical protein [Beijerinckiaceae bacterium]
MRHIGPVLVLLAAGIGLSAAPALAQTRHPVRVRRVYTAPPLTVHRRSYLDPGVMAPVGSENSYVWAVTQPRQDMMEQGFGRSKFGNETLPGQFLPGRPEALIEF